MVKHSWTDKVEYTQGEAYTHRQTSLPLYNFNEITTLRLKGYTWREIAGQLGKNYSALYQWYQREKARRANGEKYDVIYADPPWHYSPGFKNRFKGKRRDVVDVYSTMELEAIKQMVIPAKRDAILFLWVTSPKIDDGLAVMKAWGFDYKTQIIWNKKRMGLGVWSRIQHEILLIGTKGKFPPPIPSKRIRSVYHEKSKAHSKKPQYFRNMITDLYPDLSKIELFARNSSVGFDVMGNQIGDKFNVITNFLGDDKSW